MNDWRGIEYASVSDPRARVALAEIHDFLFQLSPAIARLGKGQKPDSSGDTIGALDDYFFLPGRLSPQTGYFGTAAGASAGFLSSTKHTTKGKWFFNSARTMVVDEANVLLGIGTAAPAAVGHFKGNPQPGSGTASATGTVTQTGTTEWTGSSDGVGFGAPTAAQIAADGSDLTLWKNIQLIADTTISVGTTPFSGAASSVTMTWRAKRDGVTPTGNVFTYTYVDGAGNAWTIQNQASDYTTTPTTFGPFALTLSGSGTPNTMSIRFNSVTSPNTAISFYNMTFTVTGAGTVAAIVTQERTASTTLPYSLWVNESGATVASVNASAQMVARGFVMTDPAGSDADTIIHRAPTSITQQTLTWPGSITASGFLQVSADGTLFWTVASAMPTRIQHRWQANGAYKTDTEVDGAYIAPHAITLTKTILHRRSAGTSGTTTVALQRNGTTIDNRSVTAAAGANATDTSGTLALAIAAGDRLTINATAEAGTPRDYAFIFEGN